MAASYYVLRHTETGLFVSVGGHHSYTKDLRSARTYAIESAAQSDACGNEVPVSVGMLLPPPVPVVRA